MTFSVKSRGVLHRHLGFFLSLAASVYIAAGDRRVACPTKPSLLGYTSIFDINHDILEEMTAIEKDSSLDPKATYRYTLCPDSVFDGSERLSPLLNNSVFVCGENGDSSDSCVISGGEVQVLILEWPTTLDLEYLSFQGITFADSTRFSIAAFAHNKTTAEFNDCHWKNGTGGSAVHIAYLSPMDWTFESPSLTEDSEFLPEGKGDNVFSNNNRKLGVLGDEKTGDVASNGMRLLEDQVPRASMRVNIYDSSITDSFISDGGDYKGFYNTGYLYLKNVLVANNVGSLFTNVVGGVLVVDNSRFVNNTVQAAIRANGDAFVQVEDTEFVENNAFGNVVSIGSEVYISRCAFSESIMVDGGDILCLNETVLSLINCCFIGGRSLAPVILDETSSMDTSNNFGIRQDSSFCSDTMGILQGLSGAECMLNRATGCNGECLEFDADSCAFDLVGTATYATTAPYSAGYWRLSLVTQLVLGLGTAILLLL